MSILVNKDTRLLVQGITGTEGLFFGDGAGLGTGFAAGLAVGVAAWPQAVSKSDSTTAMHTIQ